METSVAATAYIAQAEARNLSPHTIEAQRWGPSYITAPTLPEKPEEIQEILAKASRRLAPDSLHDLCRYLGMFYRWAQKRFDVAEPTVKVAPPPANVCWYWFRWTPACACPRSRPCARPTWWTPRYRGWERGVDESYDHHSRSSVKRHCGPRRQRGGKLGEPSGFELPDVRMWRLRKTGDAGGGL